MGRPLVSRTLRPLIVNTDNIQVRLSNGKLVTLDLQDRFLVEDYNWTVDQSTETSVYFCTTSRTVPRRKLYLHRVLMLPSPGEYVDFKDDDQYNYRRSNMVLTRFSKRRLNAYKPKARVLAKWTPQYVIE